MRSLFPAKKFGPADQTVDVAVTFLANVEFVRPHFLLMHSLPLCASIEHTLSSTPSVPVDRNGAISLSFEPVITSIIIVIAFVYSGNYGFVRLRFSLQLSSYLSCGPFQLEATQVRTSLKEQGLHLSFN
jgi:hypothetical protein